MQHTALGVVFVATLEVVARVDAHVTGGHRDIAIVGNIYSCRVVHFIIGTRGDGETADSTLAVVEDGIDVRREHTLVGIVHLDGRIGPPEEGLRHISAIIEHALDLQIGTTGA